MKKFLLFIFILLLLSGGGAGLYWFIVGGALPWEEPQEVQLAEEPEVIEPLNLVEIRSFKVPVLHNSVAVKFLVFHIVLNLEDKDSVNAVNARMNHLVDMYIRYLVAHYEVNAVDNVLSRTDLSRILHQATHEVMGNRIRLKDIIIQGVFQKDTGV